MTIRSKIILVVLPLIIVTLVLGGTASYFAAAKGITRITQQFFSFKVNELRKYTENQWALLVENNYSGQPDMVRAAENAVESYARSIILSDTELIFALDGEGTVVMATSEFAVSADETAALLGLLEEAGDDLFNARIGGTERVIRTFHFTPFQWWILLSEENTAFYRDVDSITIQTLIMIGAASAAAVLMLLFFAKLLTTPLGRVVKTMDRIIGSTDLSARVEVEYRDETGQLAHTFNLMIAELEKAYSQIKRYAFDAVLARKKEQRIRQIFQKYVPKDLIDKFFAAPESMLVGDNRLLSVLFSDIRSFTTISEGMAPDDLVNSLNRYFSGQVDIIMNRNGIVDKYIGDAIMAFWGAPVKHDDDALQSVLSGLDMIDALRDFNEAQRELEKPEFRIGIGINYGTVTVGNIGSERKMDYTVIGDMVNLASRMEGLTKPYHQEILISETIHEEIKEKLPTRLLDTVAVKGKTRGVKIYTVKRSVAGSEERAWAVHNGGMAAYYRRSFGEAAAKFQEVLTLLPDDFIAKVLLARCKNYALNPPPEGWDGVEVMKTK
ncbi:MAG: HAMP domain-containing protein [Spirochaetaceae bacterium]|jgi:class 3 adenylate cyclase/HAMP domain-containing protein|nr:HAMP domain-containing protein [Spirochaetaceae bacterium]